MRKKTEALYLVDDSVYLHLQAVQNDPANGFAYEAMDAVSKLRIASGKLEALEVAEMPQRNDLACARLLAMQEIGLDGVKVQEVALRTLDKFPEARHA